jgi:hypothetical protein
MMAPLSPLPPSTLGGVIQANATPLADSWDFDATLFNYPYQSGFSKYERGEKGKWRIASNHAYKAELIPGTNGQQGTARIYKNAGVFEEFQLFNFENVADNNPDKWLPLSTVVKYSPNGEPLEERDMMNKYSTAKFGYNAVLPTLLAHNASYDKVQFESFEKVYINGTVLEDGLPAAGVLRSTTFAHAGKYSAELSMFKPNFTLKPVKGTTEATLLKVWVKELQDMPADIPSGGVHPTLKTYVGNTVFDFKKVAQTGDWSLYEAVITTLGDFTPSIKYISSGGVFIDDIRLQPRNSSMTAYVYDAVNMRLLASFDDQHFGLYYQYTPEGKLMRKFIETEKGKKTIIETQYHTIEQPRN